MLVACVIEQAPVCKGLLWCLEINKTQLGCVPYIRFPTRRRATYCCFAFAPAETAPFFRISQPPIQ
jgi:hypothetical protein